jgi:hypothetical protein
VVTPEPRARPENDFISEKLGRCTPVICQRVPVQIESKGEGAR